MYVTREPIVLESFFSWSSRPACGAAASFVGMVRDHDHGRPVKALFYECYVSMAEKMIATVIEGSKKRWEVDEVRVSHRIGFLEVGETAVAIAVSAAHREEAFAACRFMIEQIKIKVPIWKKEIFEDGASEWVLCSHAAETVLT